MTRTATRTLSIAALLAAGFALPAFAADEKANAGDVSANAAELSQLANQRQAINVLAGQGYKNVTITGRDDDGRWTGVAFKDGQKRFVAVGIPAPQPVPATN